MTCKNCQEDDPQGHSGGNRRGRALLTAAICAAVLVIAGDALMQHAEDLTQESGQISVRDETSEEMTEEFSEETDEEGKEEDMP